MKPAKLSSILKFSSALCFWSVLVESNFYAGKHSGELISGHLVIPTKVNYNGDFLSHNVTEHHRHKRSLETEESQDFHYRIELQNETFHLELKPHKNFMIPTMIIERHRRDLRIRKKIEKNTNCHYHGKIRGHPESRVAISACGGLVGHIKTKNIDYYIEPSNNHDAHPINGHPHVVFHRSAVKDKKKRNRHRNKNNYHQHQHHNHQHRRHQHNHKQQQEQHHHHHHHHHNHQNHRHRQQRLQSNCATKEPKRQTETRIEWQPQGKVIVQGGRKIRRHHHHSHSHTQRNGRKATTVPPSDNNNNNNNDDDDDDNSHRESYTTTQQPDATVIVAVTETAAVDVADKFQYQTTEDVELATPLKATRQQQQQYQHRHRQQSCSSSNSSTDSTGNCSLTTDVDVDVDADADADADADVDRGNNSQRNSSTMIKTTTTTTTTTPTTPTQHRTKRSISSPRHVETLIVADSTMVAFHDDVETYLLTIMNMVSSLYKDPSIGNSIEVVVVRIVLLDEVEAHPDLNLTENAQANLDRFCGWQHTLNAENEADPYHHDVAILITRKNICGNNCMTLGLANVGGMCKPRQSCSVNEDNGIILSHTIAHELGHNFGMFHDTAKIGCHGRVGPIVHIMTPTFVADTLQVSWSNCSRKFITHFLDQGLGDCLDDKPEFKGEYEYPELPPGALYNAELQCRLQYNLTDENVSSCSSLNEICSQLWCRVNGECVTNMRPTAPGTNCGKHKWCQNGQCVPMEEMTPRNGGWGNWSEWSNCSRTCGGGVSIQQRECNNPVPLNGGLFCIGERKRYKICNKHDCPEDDVGFRAQQCSKFNDVLYRGGFYKWLPFFDKLNPCKLFCTDEDDSVIANWGDVVEDGTPCMVGTKNMCIDGICKKVGCDWIVDSDTVEDRCGICGGNGENCEPVKEIFNQDFNVTDGYVEIVTIPAKSRHITIKELSNSPNFLSIGKANSSSFYLNGDRLISMAGEFEIAGIESMYDREDEQETIKIPQPIEHSITLYVIVRGVKENEGIYYEFTLPAAKSTQILEYTWKLSGWTPCTTTCGGGLQYRKPQCFEGEKLISDEVLCLTNSDNRPPDKISRHCNEIPCTAHWWAGQWQMCPTSVDCRMDASTPNTVKRRRTVQCLDQNELVLPESMCDKAIRPTDVEICDQVISYCSDSGDDDVASGVNSIFKNEILLD